MPRLPAGLLLVSCAVTAMGAPAYESGMATGAQSMTVLGGDDSARQCYFAASTAARSDIAEGGDLVLCDRALARSRLTDRDRLATHVNRGILHMALRNLDAAAADFDAALALDPVSGEVFVDRGNLSFLRGDFEAAIADYTQALAVGLDQDAVAYFNRGMANEHLRRYAAARSDFQHAAILAPDWRQPRLRLETMAVFDAARGDAAEP